MPNYTKKSIISRIILDINYSTVSLNIVIQYSGTPELYNLQYVKDNLLYTTGEKLETVLNHVKKGEVHVDVAKAYLFFVGEEDSTAVKLQEVIVNGKVVSFTSEKRLDRFKPGVVSKVLHLYNYIFFFSPEEGLTCYLKELNNGTFYTSYVNRM